MFGPALHPLLRPLAWLKTVPAEGRHLRPYHTGVSNVHSWGDAVMGRRTTTRKRLTVNIGPQERVARIVVGLVGVVVGIVVLKGSPGAVVAVLAVLLGVAGLDLVVTGALGHCPLYARLGHVPASVRRS